MGPRGAGETIFHFFTPARLGQHRLWFTSAFSLAVFAVFFFCIGEFPQFCLLHAPPLPDPAPCLRAAYPRLLSYGPAQMTHWMSPGVRAAPASRCSVNRPRVYLGQTPVGLHSTYPQRNHNPDPAWGL